MGRPKASELTERELELMHVFWKAGERTIADIQTQLQRDGRELAYTTVATLVRILVDKKYLKQVGARRPYSFKPMRSFQDVSGRMLGELVERLFGGSREALLVRLMDDESLSEVERRRLHALLSDEELTAEESNDDEDLELL